MAYAWCSYNLYVAVTYVHAAYHWRSHCFCSISLSAVEFIYICLALNVFLFMCIHVTFLGVQVCTQRDHL